MGWIVRFISNIIDCPKNVCYLWICIGVELAPWDLWLVGQGLEVTSSLAIHYRWLHIQIIFFICGSHHRQIQIKSKYCAQVKVVLSTFSFMIQFKSSGPGLPKIPRMWFNWVEDIWFNSYAKLILLKLSILLNIEFETGSVLPLSPDQDNAFQGRSVWKGKLKVRIFGIWLWNIYSI